MVLSASGLVDSADPHLNPASGGTHPVFPDGHQLSRSKRRISMDHVEQISVFLENKVGRLAEVARVLAEANINIRALSLADTSDFGILRLIVNDNNKAKEELKKAGFTLAKTEVTAVEVSDHPGGLYHILRIMQKANVNVEYMYAFVQQSDANAVLIFCFNNPSEALRILKDNNVRVIKGEKLYEM
jgi:hypothetical protein